jgi:molecular chaperone GrpE (heat shock protein)
MDNMSVPKVVKWPFFLADVVLLAFAGWALNHLNAPPGAAMVLACALAVGLAGVLSVLPFILEYRAALRLMESDHLHDTVSKIQQVEQLAGRIDNATAQWQTAHELAQKTTATASDITARITSETKAFTAFFEKTQDAEKSRMQLEIEKMRRAEGEFLQVITALLDHVFALHQAGSRSGQPHLIEQLDHFQAACRDLARRVGLVPFVPEPNEPFNEQAHQPVDRQSEVPAGARVVAVMATGYTYQGQLLRRALVTVATPGENEPGTVAHSFAPVEASATVQEAAPADASAPQAAPAESAPAAESSVMSAPDEESVEIAPAPEEAPAAPVESAQSEPAPAISEAGGSVPRTEANESEFAPQAQEEAQPVLEAPAVPDGTVISPATPEPVVAPLEEVVAPENTQMPAPENVPVEQEFPGIAVENPAEKTETPKPARRSSKSRPPQEQELF